MKLQSVDLKKGEIVKRKKTKEEAAIKETKEEVKLVKYRNLRYYGDFYGMTAHGKKDLLAHVFQAEYEGGSIKPFVEITGSRLMERNEDGLKMTKCTQNIINSIYFGLLKVN